MATLVPAQATGRLWDALVVGAGPAGALAARELARRGAAVLLVDKASFPRWKVCGACLNLDALGTLRGVGLESLTPALGAVPLVQFELVAGGRAARLPLPGGVALSRAALDAGLVDAAIASGADFLDETQVRLGPTLPQMRQVVLSRAGVERLADARVVLVAAGLGGHLVTKEEGVRISVEEGSRIGAGAIAEDASASYGPGTIFMACGRAGYVGLVRVEDDRLNIAAALDASAIKKAGSLGPAAAAVLTEAGMPAPPGLATLAWRGTPRLTRRARPPVAERLFVLGDAAGYVEPFTGEGMAWALACGAAVAPLAHHVCRHGWDGSVKRRWLALYEQIVGRRRWLARAIAGVLRRPSLTRTFVAALSFMPGLAAPLVRHLNRSCGVSAVE